MNLSISSIQGHLTNIQFTEHLLNNLPLTSHVIGCHSNFLSIGVKKYKKERIIPHSPYRQGSGRYFNSQITFVVTHQLLLSPLHFKLFRNGKFIVIGYRYESFEMFYIVISIIIDYVKRYFGLERSDIICDSKLYSYNLQNYKFQYKYPIVLIDLYTFLQSAHAKYDKINVNTICNSCELGSTVIDLNAGKKRYEYILASQRQSILDSASKLLSLLSSVTYGNELQARSFIQDACKMLLTRRYVQRNHRIAHIFYNPKQFSGLIVKVLSVNLPCVAVTIKLFNSGKINIDGKQNWINAEFYRIWITNLLDIFFTRMSYHKLP